VSGSIDLDMTNINANELMQWSAGNLWNSGTEGSYAVRHGNQPVSDFGRPRRGHVDGVDRSAESGKNIYEMSFPILYPFGRGGIETDRKVPVMFREHVQWSLRHHDRRFRVHETFMFVAFSTLQKREALGAARLQMQRKDFEANAEVLATLTQDKLTKAIEEESRSQPISDPAVKLLRRHVDAVAGRVTGTNNERTKNRSQITSTSIATTPPSLWLTWNPCDLHDPLAQVFVGEDIDMDKFCATAGPDKQKRAANISSDPFAAAKFFHYTVRAMIETLFGCKRSRDRIHSHTGIFGEVSAYFGVVESQGRGSLHIHMLVWLKNTPTHDELHELLKTEAFRDRVKAFIRQNLRAYVPGLDNANDVRNTPNEIEIAYSRPPDPDSMNFAEDVADFERRVVRAKQVHTCELRRCLNVDRQTGRLVCKRRAPWPTAEDDFVNEDGTWGPKRRNPFINGYVPGVSVCMRGNNDGKLLTNGKDTKNLTFYATKYAAKPQNLTNNFSVLSAKSYQWHELHPRDYETLKDSQRVLLFRIANAMNKEQELAATMVVSYLMNWGDTVKSHNYVPIYWTSFRRHLWQMYPSLKDHGSVEEQRWVIGKYEVCVILRTCSARRPEGDKEGASTSGANTSRQVNMR